MSKIDKTHDREEDIDLCPLCGCNPTNYDIWSNDYGLVLLDQDIKNIDDHDNLDLYEKILLTLLVIKDTGDADKLDELICALRGFLESAEKDSARALSLLVDMKKQYNRDGENEG